MRGSHPPPEALDDAALLEAALLDAALLDDDALLDELLTVAPEEPGAPPLPP